MNCINYLISMHIIKIVLKNYSPNILINILNLGTILKNYGNNFFDGTLNYTKTDKEYHSNSYIENYNKRIKLKLSEYLFGKSKTKISSPLFNYFIKEKEHNYRTDNINNEPSEIKNTNYHKEIENEYKDIQHSFDKEE